MNLGGTTALMYNCTNSQSGPGTQQWKNAEKEQRCNTKTPGKTAALIKLSSSLSHSECKVFL